MATPPATPDRDRLLRLVDGFAGQRILILGDLVLDRFVIGTPKRLSREAPVLILRYDEETRVPGGGANAVYNVAALDGKPLPVGVVGDDENGRALLELFAERRIPTDGILVRRGYPTPCKTRILGGGKHGIKQQIVRYDIETPLDLREEERSSMTGALERTAPGCRVFLVSDYGLGGADPALASSLSGSPLLRLGDSRHRLTEFTALDGATPNEEELEEVDGIPDDGGTAARASLLRERLDARFVLVTRGSRGMVLVEEGRAASIPVHGTDQVADVTGAGDTVIGTFALASAAGASPLEAALLANYAGGVVVLKAGTATLSRDELRGAVASDLRPLEELRWDTW